MTAASTEFEGKVALVTGAGAGIGRSAALRLGEGGATVVAVDLDERRLTDLVGEIQGSGATAAAHTLDLEDSQRVGDLVPEVVRRFGRLDILVNNAGVTGSGPLLDLPESAWARALTVNLTAPFLLTKAFGRHVAGREPGGKIVNVLTSSVFRAVGISGADYVASKAGLMGLTRAAAGDLARLDINVNAVAPGITDTPRVRAPDTTDEEHAAFVAGLATTGPMANAFGRVSKPEDVAAVIAFLCSPGARQVTGQVVHTSAGAVV